ncbi:uncharacterized protein BROUX77_005001 [Berkeleyomyces rouxiae]|uniref:uncharacterized protein n=1 Tax=Berkeleyomyces rouxiae TaxID=2035830 RepID=UPI003B808B4D
MSLSRIKSPAMPGVTYPAVFCLNPEATTFGILIRDDVMMSMRTIASDPVDLGCRQSLEFDLARKQIRFCFGLARAATKQTPCVYKAIITFDNIDAIYYENNPGTRQSQHASLNLRLTMQCPPLYFMKRADSDAKPGGPNHTQEPWARAVNIGAGEDARQVPPLNFHTSSNKPSFIDLGKWKTLRFRVAQWSDRSELSAALDDFKLPLLPEPTPLVLTPRATNNVWSILDSSETSTPPSFNNFAILSSIGTTPQKLPWAVRYQLEVCITRGIFEEHAINEDFIKLLAAKSEEDARFLLEQAADLRDRSTISKTKILIPNPHDIFDLNNALLQGCRANIRPRIPHYCALIRKAIITPTTMYFMTPAIESSNRVLRRYQHLQDRFLRVQFSDELLNGRLRRGKSHTQSNSAYVRIFQTLYQGIRVGDRIFKFLACGNSQMREGGAYFFADTPDVTRDDIRTWMGNFSSIRSIAKCTARLGQCFSTTRDIRGISMPVICRIADIERNGYCFTDGIGKISTFLARLIMEEMELFVAPGEPIPAAYQFRMGGCKGVLAVSDDATGMQVHIRKSQEKFISDFNALEVIRVSQFAIATLNRQTIVLLSSMGVPDETFEKLLNDQLTAYEKAMVDLPTAVTLLTQHVDENTITLQIADMVRAGFLKKDCQEPFVMSIMSLWRAWSLKLLKEKARLVIPQGAFLLGCVDESGLLRGHSIASEGSKSRDIEKLPQIFVRIPHPSLSGEYMTVEGLCIVGRNPSLHPGDIRVVQAVSIPGLNHLTNVVVFPSIGDRDVPSMLSGGDLDGDDFFVIWDQTLIPPQWNHPPMVMKAAKPVENPKDVSIADMQMFFVKYLRDDILPVIAHAHLALADAQGAKSKECLKLAALHSKAVDFAKSGIPAEMPHWLHPKKWPHFMENKRGAIYHSTRPLGVIYDRVQHIEFSPFYTKAMHQSILDQAALPEHLTLARQIKLQYDMEMRRLMGQFEVDTEFEAWTTFVLRWSRTVNSYKLQERLGREISVLKRTFREMCVEKVGGVLSFYTVRPLLIAMYHVTHEELREALAILASHGCGLEEAEKGNETTRKPHPKNMPLISFPWLFPEFMCRLTAGKDKEEDAFVLTEASSTGLRHFKPKQHYPIATTTPEIRSKLEDETAVSVAVGATSSPTVPNMLPSEMSLKTSLLPQDPVLDLPTSVVLQATNVPAISTPMNAKAHSVPVIIDAAKPAEVFKTDSPSDDTETAHIECLPATPKPTESICEPPNTAKLASHLSPVKSNPVTVSYISTQSVSGDEHSVGLLTSYLDEPIPTIDCVVLEPTGVPSQSSLVPPHETNASGVFKTIGLRSNAFNIIPSDIGVLSSVLKSDGKSAGFLETPSLSDAWDIPGLECEMRNMSVTEGLSELPQSSEEAKDWDNGVEGLGASKGGPAWKRWLEMERLL